MSIKKLFRFFNVSVLFCALFLFSCQTSSAAALPTLPSQDIAESWAKAVFSLSAIIIALLALGIAKLLENHGASITSGAPSSPMPLWLLKIVGKVPSRAKKQWGQIIEQGTDLPVRNASVELVLAKHDSREVAARSLTDKDGYYGFDVPEGEYVIRLVLSNARIVKLPSGYYQEGEAVEVRDGKTPEVPPIVVTHLEQAILMRAAYFSLIKTLEKTFFILAVFALIVGTFLNLFNLSSGPSFSNGSILVLTVLFWFFIAGGAGNHKYTGKVIDRYTRLPIPFAVVRVLDQSGQRLIESAISAEDGAFVVHLRKGRYMVLAAKEGYRIVRPEYFSTKLNVLGTVEMLPH